MSAASALRFLGSQQACSVGNLFRRARSPCGPRLNTNACAKQSYPEVQVGDVDGVGQHDAHRQQPGAKGAHERRHPRLQGVQHEAVAVHSDEQKAERRDVHRDVLQHGFRTDID
jgi:hypothetical protein